jgi:hypothetical protein
MPLSRCLYFSTATDLDPLPHQLRQIVADSQANNLRLSITGCLIQVGQTYIGCLEGRRMHISSRLLAIARDPRHTALTLISYREVDTRWFAGWSLLQPPLHTVLGLIDRVAVDHHFEPRDYREGTYEQLFQDIAALHPVAQAETLLEWGA